MHRVEENIVDGKPHVVIPAYIHRPHQKAEVDQPLIQLLHHDFSIAAVNMVVDLRIFLLQLPSRLGKQRNSIGLPSADIDFSTDILVQLKDLEDELGKKLLIRGSKKVTLTEDGMLLRKRAEEMIDLMEKTAIRICRCQNTPDATRSAVCPASPRHVLHLSQPAGELRFRPLYPTLEAGLCIVWKKYQVFSRASKLFLNQLRAEFGWGNDLCRMLSCRVEDVLEYIEDKEDK